jgi:hypothetical protein
MAELVMVESELCLSTLCSLVEALDSHTPLLGIVIFAVDGTQLPDAEGTAYPHSRACSSTVVPSYSALLASWQPAERRHSGPRCHTPLPRMAIYALLGHPPSNAEETEHLRCHACYPAVVPS